MKTRLDTLEPLDHAESTEESVAMFICHRLCSMEVDSFISHPYATAIDREHPKQEHPKQQDKSQNDTSLSLFTSDKMTTAPTLESRDAR